MVSRKASHRASKLEMDGIPWQETTWGNHRTTNIRDRKRPFTGYFLRKMHKLYLGGLFKEKEKKKKYRLCFIYYRLQHTVVFPFWGERFSIICEVILTLQHFCVCLKPPRRTAHRWASRCASLTYEFSILCWWLRYGKVVKIFLKFRARSRRTEPCRSSDTSGRCRTAGMYAAPALCDIVHVCKQPESSWVQYETTFNTCAIRSFSDTLVPRLTNALQMHLWTRTWLK